MITAVLNLLNPYAWLMALRRTMYRRDIFKRESVSVPVISIGNISFGGTGKSPMTILVAQYLLEEGKRPGIVLRGYGRKTRETIVVQNNDTHISDTSMVGDEAVMLAEALPKAIVVVAENRPEGARKAIALGADVIILDDGFQHRRLKRDLDIVLIDAEVGTGPVLPFGRSRESGGALHDADVVIFTNAVDPSRSKKNAQKIARFINSDCTVASMFQKPLLLQSLTDDSSYPCETIDGRKVLAISSIARPERFHSLLASLGAAVLQHVLPDHAEYSRSTVERALEQAERQRCDLIVTTAKDAVKARTYYQQCESSMPVFTLTIGPEFLAGQQGLYSRLDELINVPRTATL